MGPLAKSLALALLLAQSAAQKPAFEVAAIKRSDKLDAGGTLGLLPGGRFRAINWDARALIGVAYRTNPPRNLLSSQILGGPDWISTERYDITAKIVAELAATMDLPGRDPALMPKLVQSLLEDRFKLKMHYEKREMPVYALVIARKDGTLGPQLRVSTTDCEKERPKCRLQFLTGHYTFGSATLDTLATSLSGPAGRLVLERTGLSGKFDLELEWAAEAGSDKPSIFAAVQEQLGLKLESVREPVDVVVIDHIERPTED
jgi:bla regulator protein BlaR1